MALLKLLTVLAVAGFASSNTVNTTANKTGNFELLILHNNDMHARFEQTSQLSGTCTPADRDAGKCYGGFPRVAYVVKEARKAAANGQGPPVLYLNAGDTYTGTAWFTLYKWKIAAEFINALEPDAVSLGNHEFDDGVSGLTPFIENLTSPVLAANLVLTKEPILQAEKNLMNSIIFNINGTKVGIIGYLTPETKTLATPNHVEYIDEVIALREEVAKLKQDGVNIIIALGHSGWAKDVEIAKEVDGLDLVIGGHTNTFLWNGAVVETEDPIGPYPFIIKQKNGRNVPVVQAYAYTKYLGKLHLIFDSEGEIISFDGNPLILNRNIPQDPDVLKIIDKYKAEVYKVTEEVVGSTAVRLEVAPCRTKECNLGNVIADAMVHRYLKDYRGEGWTDAPIAIIQKGGIRAGIVHPQLPTNVTMGDLLTVSPFGNNIVKKTLNGSTIWAMLEYSVSKHTKTNAPGFLHFSGIKVVYDFHKRPFMRVVKVYIRCGQCLVPEYRPINKTENYNVLMSTFLSMGGDGYDMFLNKITKELPFTDLDTLATYFRDESPIYTGLEDRITVYNVDRLRSSATALPTPLICIVLLYLASLLV